jgi:hypothetical protein
MVAFIGMAAFAVDLGWIYLQSSNVKKASEAAALAAVTHMPLTTPQAAGSVIATGLPASNAADAIAAKHGYSSADTVTMRWANPSQARVDITSSTRTFFLGFFGIDTVSLHRHSLAEQLPPLKLGGDTDRLGTYYDDAGKLVADESYWLAINGQRRVKQDGDPFSTSRGGNPQYRSPAYYYAVDVSDTDRGKPLNVLVYDGSNNNTAPDHPDDISPGNDGFTFSLIQPDSTPGDPADNRTNAGGHICSRVFLRNDADGSNVWTSVCSFTPTKRGIHVLEVSVSGGDQAINGFALRVDGGTTTSVYGLGYMSLWMRDPGTSPSLQIVRLDSIYAGTQVIISAFDLGDITGDAEGAVRFEGSLAGLDCRVRVWPSNRYPGDGSTSLDPAWTNDDSPGAPCDLVTKSGNSGGNQGLYNNQWVEFLFDVDPKHSCSGSACWARVRYNFTGGSPTDRTTWGARINGTPLHLLRDSTPLP